MTQITKEIIETHIDLIDNNEYDKLYDQLAYSCRYRSISDFTKTLLQAGINPLNYLTRIPEAYMWRSDITTLHNIPRAITDIGDSAYAVCESLTSIILPEKIGYIGHSAFDGCNHLSYVELPKSLQRIRSGAFQSCDQLKEVIYHGTTDQWNHIEIAESAFPYDHQVNIKCTDGTVILHEEV